jgi:hypothetical protein
MMNDEEFGKLETASGELAVRILQVLNSSKIDTDSDDNSIPRTAISALFDALIAVVGSIECRDCRKNACKTVRGLMPGALVEAMRRPSSPVHVH